MRKYLHQIPLLFCFLMLGCDSNIQPQSKPNIVLILIDDLGYGDVGCYGNKTNLTPNIDQLAADGIRLTDFHTNGPMCTPTRAALLTGRYQNRLGVMFEGPLSGKTQYDEGMPLEAVTIAETLKTAGYATGIFGKWHLGYHEPFLPTNQGFDEFRGLGSGDGDHHSHINRWGREDWWNNNQIEMEEGYSTDLITKYSKAFIEKEQDKPFFLYMSHIAIHFPWQGPDDPAQREKGKSYENDKWGIIEDRDNVQPHVKAMVESIDRSVGVILNTLRELNLDENTLVIFTSDNGGYIHYNHLFKNISNNGPLRGQKADMYEGGHRVPFIARWPGKIKPGITSDATVMTMDLYPTFATIAGVENLESHSLDGIDLNSMLLKNTMVPERTLFWKRGNEIAVREGSWKLVKEGDQLPELFDLEVDLGESENVSEIHGEVVSSLMDKYMKWEKQMYSED